MAKNSSNSSNDRDEGNQPFGDVYAKVRGDKGGNDGKERGDKLVKVGAVWETQNGNYEFTLEAEPLAWQRHQPGAVWPQLRSFIVVPRGGR
jgi:hypothetical protein